MLYFKDAAFIGFSVALLCGWCYLYAASVLSNVIPSLRGCPGPISLDDTLLLVFFLRFSLLYLPVCFLFEYGCECLGCEHDYVVRMARFNLPVSI